MEDFILPPSPNPFRSRIITVNSQNILAMGCKHDLYFYQIDPSEIKYVHRIMDAHKDYITSVAINIVDDTLASAGKDLQIKIWQMSDYQLLCTNAYHTNKPASVLCWNKSGSLLSGDANGNVYLWCPQTKSVRHFVYECGGVVSISASSVDDNVVAVGYDGGILVIGTTSGKGNALMKVLAHTEDIIGLLWSEIDGKSVVVSVSLDSEIKSWDIEKKEKIFCVSFFGEECRNKSLWYCICPLADAVCAVSDCCGRIYQIDYKGAKKEISAFHSRPLLALCNHNGVIISAAFDRKFGCFYHHKELQGFGTFGSYTFHVCMSKHGLLATGSADKLVRIFKLSSENNPMIPKIYDARYEVRTLAWHPSIEGRLVFGTEKGRVGFINYFAKKAISFSSALHEGAVLHVDWVLKKEKYCALSLGVDGELTIHSRTEGTDIKHSKISLTETKGRFTCLHTSNGLTAVGNDCGEVLIYSKDFIKRYCVLHSFNTAICCLQCHPSDPWLAAAGRDSDVHIFELSYDSCPDVISSPKVILKGHEKTISSMSWNKNLIATSSYDCTVKIWIVTTGELVFTYPGHENTIVRCVCWNLCVNDCLISAGNDDALHFWSYKSFVEKKFRIISKKKPEKQKNKKKRMTPTQKNICPKVSTNYDELGGGGEKYTLESQSMNCVELGLSPLFSVLLPLGGNKRLAVLLHVLKKIANPCITEIEPNMMLRGAEIHHAALWTDWKSIQNALQFQAEIHLKKNNYFMYIIIKAFCGDFESIASDFLEGAHPVSEFALLLIANAHHERYRNAVERFVNQVETTDPLKAVVLLLSLQRLQEALSLLDQHRLHFHKLVLIAARLHNNANLLSSTYLQHAENASKTEHFMSALSFIAAGELEHGIKMLFQSQKLIRVGVEALIFLGRMNDAVAYVNKYLILNNDWLPDLTHDSFKYLYALKCVSSILQGEINLSFANGGTQGLPAVLFNKTPLHELCKEMMKNYETKGLIDLLNNLSFDSPLQVPALILSTSIFSPEDLIPLQSIIGDVLYELVNRLQVDKLLYLVCCTAATNYNQRFSKFYHLAKVYAHYKSRLSLPDLSQSESIIDLRSIDSECMLRKTISLPLLFSPNMHTSPLYEDSFTFADDKLSYMIRVYSSRLKSDF